MIRWFLLLVFLFSGCTLLPPSAPDARLREAQLVRSGLLTQTWELELVLANRNWRKVTLRDLEYTLFLDGQSLVTHPHTEPLTLPPRSETTIKIPLRSFLGETLQRRRLSGHSKGEPVHYRIAGSARWGQSPDKQEFSSEGWIRLAIYPDSVNPESDARLGGQPCRLCNAWR